MKYGELYSRLNSTFLRLDLASSGYLSSEEIYSVCTREGMEAYADVLSENVTDSDVVSYVDFLNALKQKYEPGHPSVYLGATSIPRRPKRSHKGAASGSSRPQRQTASLLRSPAGPSDRSPDSKGSPSPTRVPTLGFVPSTGPFAFAHELSKADFSGRDSLSPGEIRAGGLGARGANS